MITNLQDYLGKGRSVYASDWASEVLRIAFPNRIYFLGSESTFGAARVGAAAFKAHRGEVIAFRKGVSTNGRESGRQDN